MYNTCICTAVIYLQHYSLLSQSGGTQTLDFKCLDIFGNLDHAHQSIVRKPQQSPAIQELSYFLRFSTKTIYHDVFRPHPATRNIQKFRDIYTWTASNFAKQDDWAGLATAAPVMMTVELGISMTILWHILFWFYSSILAQTGVPYGPLLDPAPAEGKASLIDTWKYQVVPLGWLRLEMLLANGNSRVVFISLFNRKKTFSTLSNTHTSLFSEEMKHSSFDLL